MIDQAALFEDDEDRAAFSQLVLSAYGTILTINEFKLALPCSTTGKRSFSFACC